MLQETGLIQKVIPNIVTGHANAMLCMNPSEQEIHHVVMNLNYDSAPGPDGFDAIIFQKYWNIIKSDVIIAVLQFFMQGWINPNYNANSLVLIPKKNEPNYLNYYRPIALENFKFKII